MSEAVSEAAARLERAVGRLAEAVAKPRPPAGIPPEQVEALASRLDVSLAKLRAALAELDAPELDAPELDAAEPEAPDPDARELDARGPEAQDSLVEEDGLPSASTGPEDEER